MKVKLQGNETSQKIYSSLSKITSILSKMFTISINGISMGFSSAVEEMKTWIGFEDLIICLDDLERCSVSINELFGFINNLVEHCNCKVIILADENNIGKMYANTNIEMKYMTLLMGRRMISERNNSSEEAADDICIEDLKKYNELVYSENYIYRDIKEKVIGLSLRYTPDLEAEFKSIIEDTIMDHQLIEKMNEKKEKILNCMEKCDNNNIRIMKLWLINFERIYHTAKDNFGDSKYFEEIIDRFMRYSILVACAVSKNKKLSKWETGTEIGYIKLDDGYLLEREGYRFVDDLYRDSVFDELRLCQSARSIEKEKMEEEKNNLQSNKGEAYRKLQLWYYLEDEEIKQNLIDLKTEINHNEFIPQMYQNIIALLVVLKEEEYSAEQDIAEIVTTLKEKINGFTEVIEVENFQHDSLDADALKEYHKYYDPLYECMMEKNKNKAKETIEQILDYKDGEKFLKYCKENHNVFISKRTFATLIDVDRLKDLIMNERIEGIYHLSYGFQSVYNFSNLYEYYSDDLEVLKTIKTEVENIQVDGRTRKRAIQKLGNVLNRIIQTIEQKRQS